VEKAPAAPAQRPAVAAPAPPQPSIRPEPEVAEPAPPASPPQRPAVATPSLPAAAPKPPADEVEVADRNKLPSVDIEVYFGSGSAVITQRTAAILNPLGQALTDKRLAHATFLIAGHTDAKGSAAYNRELSRRRAETVRQFLIERFDIDPKRLVSRGYGFDRLKIPGRPQAPENRRVQIVNWTSQLPR
jgi:outer membrane protein OmpA-like peptidoglycan-associated protein